ncbi:MAG: hypothetical protein V1792_22675 [Pseudomonadota bacterium]
MMDEIVSEYPFRFVLSLAPLVEFWNRPVDSVNGSRAGMFETIREELAQAPELMNPIEDLSVLERHRGLVGTLMSAVFPPALWESRAMAALIPYSLEPFLCSPAFENLVLNSDGSYKGRPALEGDAYVMARLMRAYFLILRQCYGIDEGLYKPLVQIVPDMKTGLDRYIRFKPELGFVEIRNLGGPKTLTDRQKSTILNHLSEPQVIREILPPENYEFRGFTLVEAMDVTAAEVLSALDRDLIDESTIVTREGFLRLQQRLRTLFGQSDLTASVAAVQGDQTFLLSTGCEMKCNCIFGDTTHVPTSHFVGSVFERAVKKGGVLRIRDMLEEPNRTPADEESLRNDVRALMISPLYFQGDLIGTLKLASPRPGAFGARDELVAHQILPMFSVALKQALEKLDNDVDTLIKQKCSAVHHSVEWRFKEAVLDHLENLHRGKIQEMETIVFRDVYPLYGSSDIRGSSYARNAAIRDDLTEHLNLALDVVQKAWEARRLPILQELLYQISEHLDWIGDGIGTGEEMAVTTFLRNEVEPVFKPLKTFGPRVAEAVAAYHREIDGSKGTVYNKRKDFEESVALFNERLSSYLESEEAVSQAIFPHYFDKHQTDGLDYVIYVGASMVEDGQFDDLYVRNLRIWQIIVACGIAWHADRLKSVLMIPLEATHLILVNHNPLSISFRFAEKRFDVDGAYNIGHEIIRSRIDKAMVKGGRERLTQPGKIAVVYSRPEEASEMLGHMSFLQAEGFLGPEVEHLDLDDLQDVKGLRALRVGVNLESAALKERMDRLSDQPRIPARMAG